MPITTMLLPGSNPSRTGTTASSEAGDPMRIRRSAAVPASGAMPASLPARDCARRSPHRGAGGLRRDLPFRPGALRADGFLAGACRPQGFACVAVAWAVAGVAAEGVFAAGSLARGSLAAGVVAAGGPAAVALVPGAAVTGVSVVGVVPGRVLAGAPGTGCGDEVPADGS